MNEAIATIVEKIRRLEFELETELAKRRVEFAYGAHGRKIQFEERILMRHRQLKTRLARYFLDARPLMFLVAPLIYALVVPFALLDLLVTLYQRICFPAFGVPVVQRGIYMVLDREHLAYLNVIEKMNCAYCSYANGVVAYVREVASVTEQFWCPIKHARRVIGAHDRYAKFAAFGDAESYRKDLDRLRQELK
ncbi:MAG: hypothetical protein ABI885_09415 [Gammaproteobacteria bacterium]